jgi:acyl carrier protein
MTTNDDVLNFIQEILELEEIDLTTAMGSVFGWDSLKHVELILGISEKFNIEIPPDRIGELTQVSAIIDFLKEERILGN